MSLLTAWCHWTGKRGRWSHDAAGHCAAYSLRIVGIAWAFSAWTKASWLLGASRPPFRGLTDDDKRFFAIYHLCTAYAALTCVRRFQEDRAWQTVWPLHFELHPRAWHAVRTAALAAAEHFGWVPDPRLLPTGAVHDALGAASVLAPLALLTAAVIVLDELVYRALHVVLARHNIIGLAGRPPKQPLTDADCIVCHGAGLDDAPSEPIVTFCDSGRHGAHPQCMLAWVRGRQRHSHLCPACRRRLRLRRQPWWHALRWSSLVRQGGWAAATGRAAVTAAMVALVAAMVRLSSKRLQRDLELALLVLAAQAAMPPPQPA